MNCLKLEGNVAKYHLQQWWVEFEFELDLIKIYLIHILLTLCTLISLIAKEGVQKL